MASFFGLPDSASNLSLASTNKAAPKGGFLIIGSLSASAAMANSKKAGPPLFRDSLGKEDRREDKGKIPAAYGHSTP